MWRKTAATLRKSLGEFWAVAANVPETMLTFRMRGSSQFLQHVIVPRRGQLYTALLDLTPPISKNCRRAKRSSPRRAA